jgi:hypothetical protein
MRNLWLPCLGFAALCSNSAMAINTYKDWKGAIVEFFGCPGVSTAYGQVITVPKGKTHLNSFSFWFENYTGGGPMVVRGEVYKWDGEKASGTALYESQPRKINVDFRAHEETFAPMIVVSPGRYILFASVDKDFKKCQEAGYGWGALDDVYPGGAWVHQENEGDYRHWTTAPWSTDGATDLAIKASLKP